MITMLIYMGHVSRGGEMSGKETGEVPTAPGSTVAEERVTWTPSRALGPFHSAYSGPTGAQPVLKLRENYLPILCRAERKTVLLQKHWRGRRETAAPYFSYWGTPFPNFFGNLKAEL